MQGLELRAYPQGFSLQTVASETSSAMVILGAEALYLRLSFETQRQPEAETSFSQTENFQAPPPLGAEPLHFMFL